MGDPAELIITTFDWVPEMPRGYVRDLRIRWAAEEAGLAYRVAGVPIAGERSPAHLAYQPFGQVPWLTDGDLSLFETGAILLHLGERSERLIAPGAHGRSETVQWLFAALNSIESAVLPWVILRVGGADAGSPDRQRLNDYLEGRLGRLEAVLGAREWLAGRFTIADIAMADTLRVAADFGALEDYAATTAYLARAVDRPAFRKAHADQLAFYAAADARRAKGGPDA